MLKLPFFRRKKSSRRAESGRFRLAVSRLLGNQLIVLKSFFLGITFTALFYEVFPVPFLGAGRVRAVFDSAVSEVIVVLAAWVGWFLLIRVFQYRNEARAVRALSGPEMRGGLGNGWAGVRVSEVLGRAHVRRPGDTLVARRVAAIAGFAGREGGAAMHQKLLAQAEIDAKRLELDYAPVHVLIWAIPIFGFVGTVVGIGDAIVEFSRFVQSADPSGMFGAQMREALSSVTTGLSIALNTTFLALALVVPSMLGAALLQRAEEALLLSMDEVFLWGFGAQPGAEIPASVEATGDEVSVPRWVARVEQASERFAGQVDLARDQLAGVQPLIREFTDRLLDERDGKPASTSAPLAETPAVDPSRPGV